MDEREILTEGQIDEIMDSADGCKDKKEAVYMLIELNQRLSSEYDKDKKLELLRKIFSLQCELADEVEDDDLDKAIEYRMKAAKISSKIITLEEAEDEREEMIEEAFSLFNKLELNVRDKPKDERQAYFVQLQKSTAQQNFKLFIAVNFKVAKRLYKKALNSDSWCLEGANKALELITDASLALERAKRVDEADEENEEAMQELKEKLEKLEYQTRAQKGLHEAEALIKEAEKHGGNLSETATDIFF